MNLKTTIIFSILGTLILFLTGCKDDDSNSLRAAYKQTATEPDSALSILNGMNRHNLDKRDQAYYALIYTMAQDKSGLDVDNDSLLDIACTYFNDKVGDSLYAKCQYYAGKYYMLNDCQEKAISCFKKSAHAAERQNDKLTLCLALEKLSKVARQISPRKAVGDARKAVDIYTTIPNAPKANMVYYKLNESEALLFSGSYNKSEEACREAVELACSINDSLAMSDAFQDMAVVLKKEGKYTKALAYARLSYNLAKSQGIDKLLNLATACLDADSLNSCSRIVEGAHAIRPSELYLLFYIRQKLCIKQNRADEAIKYADSTYNYMESMYTDALKQKEQYYTSMTEKQHEKGRLEERTAMLSWIVLLIVISSISIIIFIVHAHYQYKKVVRLKLLADQERRSIETRIHQEEIKHKEIQMSTMRNFILKKIEIAKRIEDIRNSNEKTFILSDKDWEEIKLFVDSIEENFVGRLKTKYSSLTNKDIHFLMLVRLKIPTKGLAAIYGISEKSVKQKLFVFKSKMEIDGEKMSLRDFIEAF